MSVVVQNTLHADSSERRPMILDGRIRANPMPDAKSSFALYWMVPATEDAKSINMTRSYVKTKCEVKMTAEDHGLSWSQHWSETDMPSVPVLLNPKAIDANTQLLAGVDARMQKISTTIWQPRRRKRSRKKRTRLQRLKMMMLLLPLRGASLASVCLQKLHP